MSGIYVKEFDSGECPHNPKKFLGLFSYNGPHEYEVHGMGEWGFNAVELYMRCRHCTAYQRKFAYEQPELVSMGIPIDRMPKNRFETVRFDKDDEEEAA